LNFFGEIALPVVLFVIMIGIGLSTRLDDFKSLLKYPKAATVGVLSQLFLLPTIALLIGWVMGYNNETILGLLLLSLCPSGTGSNIITKMVRGNLALSVSLTTISSIKSLFTIPFCLNIFLNHFNSDIPPIKLDYIEMILQIFLLTILPTIIGVFISEKKPIIVEKLRTTLKWLLPTLLFSVFTAIMIFDDPKNSDVDITEMIIPAILINVVSMFIAFLLVKIFKIEKGQVLAISIESGLKNSAIGLMIATTFLKIGEVELLILAYSFISFYLTLVLSVLLKRIS